MTVVSMVAMAGLLGCASSGEEPAVAASQPSAAVSTPAGSSAEPTATLDEPTPTPSPSPSASRPAKSPQPGITSQVGRTAFFSPTGNILCDLSPDRVFCSVHENSWDQPPPSEQCREIDWQGYVELEATADWGCTGGIYGVDAYAEANPSQGMTGIRPTWFRKGTDSIITIGSTRGYALGYGRTLRAEPMECTLTTKGLACRNTNTGHGFFVNRQTARFD